MKEKCQAENQIPSARISVQMGPKESTHPKIMELAMLASAGRKFDS